MDHNQPVVIEMETTPAEAKYLTGSKYLDLLAGFLLTLLSPFLFCFGGMLPIIFYFSKREKYPAACRGVWMGLVTIPIVIIVVIGLMSNAARMKPKPDYPEAPKKIGPPNRMHGYH